MEAVGAAVGGVVVGDVNGSDVGGSLGGDAWQALRPSARTHTNKAARFIVEAPRFAVAGTTPVCSPWSKRLLYCRSDSPSLIRASAIHGGLLVISGGDDVEGFVRENFPTLIG